MRAKSYDVTGNILFFKYFLVYKIILQFVTIYDAILKLSGKSNEFIACDEDSTKIIATTPFFFQFSYKFIYSNPETTTQTTEYPPRV